MLYFFFQQPSIRHEFLNFSVTVHPSFGEAISWIGRDRSKANMLVTFYRMVDNPFATIRMFLLSANEKNRQKFHEKTLDWCRTVENPATNFFASITKQWMEFCPISEGTYNVTDFAYDLNKFPPSFPAVKYEGYFILTVPNPNNTKTRVNILSVKSYGRFSKKIIN